MKTNVDFIQILAKMSHLETNEVSGFLTALERKQLMIITWEFLMNFEPDKQLEKETILISRATENLETQALKLNCTLYVYNTKFSSFESKSTNKKISEL